MSDAEIVDYIASLWDSQGKGGKLLWKWIPNTTGSFRDAMASAMASNAAISDTPTETSRKETK